MSSIFLLCIGALATTYVFLLGLVFIIRDPREPPTVLGGIPFISPLIEMLLGGGLSNRDKYNLPIYTLRVPGPPIYVVNSLQTIQRIDRYISTVAFSPIQARACESFMGVSKVGMTKIADGRLLSEDGYLRSFPRSIASGTSPGRGLDELSRVVVSDFAASSDRLAARGRVTIFAATTDATYGVQTPFRHPGNEQAWFEFESGILVLLTGLFPRILAKQSLKARDTLFSALGCYFRDNQSLEGSLFLLAAAVLSTAPSAFWMIWQVFSDPVVLVDCHNEVAHLVKTGLDGVCSIDLAQVQVLCFHGISDDQYLLKKGGMVLMPNEVIHSDEALWGPTARQFNHRRFLKEGSHRYPVAAFRGFGGGHVLCPGRHFAVDDGETSSVQLSVSVRSDYVPKDDFWRFPTMIMGSLMKSSTRHLTSGDGQGSIADIRPLWK
ncbi:cytochrome P450 [Xylaria sp. FL1042]|nr:cytochrome P450 [Xylaria sp. FL1042]